MFSSFHNVPNMISLASLNSHYYHADSITLSSVDAKMGRNKGLNIFWIYETTHLDRKSENADLIDLPAVEW